jgi:hypothetical protein
MFLLSSSRQPGTLTCRAERSSWSPLTPSIDHLAELFQRTTLTASTVAQSAVVPMPWRRR